MQVKKIKYEATRIIKTIPIEKDICVYHEEINIGDKKIINEGVAYQKDISNVKVDEKIKKAPFNLFNKKVLTFIKNLPFKCNDLPYIIDNPFSYVEKYGMANAEILIVDYHSHNILDIYHKPIPKAYFFDYLDGYIHNKAYDLEEVLKILKARNDIEILGEGIEDIDIIHQEDSTTKNIRFIWKPSKEDFEKIVNIKEPYERYLKIKHDILGLKQIGSFW